MTDVANSGIDGETPKKSIKPLIFGIIGATVLGGATFFVTYSGLVLGATDDSSHQDSTHAVVMDEVTFVALDPLTISLGKFATSRHLRFRAHLDVTPGMADEVRNLSPRILDVLNTYLRAVSESDLEDPTSMNRLRAQMLRRVQVVVGEGKVNDLLIAEFVLN